ncbi:MAG: hypothetical protein P0111_04600 [Nitrospira sp.]|nr:hypothetical protein [Nitrospira sp.]
MSKLIDPIRIRPGASGKLIVQLPYSPDYVAKIKTMAGRGWHQGEKYWTVPHTGTVLRHLLALFLGESVEIDPAVRAVNGTRYGASLLSVGQALHALSWSAALGRHGRTGNRPVPLRLGDGVSCRRLNTKPSPQLKDVDPAHNQIVVRGGKGDKDRYTTLPMAIKAPLVQHLNAVRRQHEEDLRQGLGRVVLPHALDRKYPNAGKEWGWQWVFPASSHYIAPLTRE